MLPLNPVVVNVFARFFRIFPVKKAAFTAALFIYPEARSQ
ncbi:hypothetical protein HMPREF3293_00247 [Christensenella minuta]|uniref:Uncharacterized protein n=1 Tax=Christensenella minuta TaxID=626937 RepID=A0A136Q8B9_9FIRM|nr:hypothetical protein HMPREF3293_00247 [Christensenella minuta]